MSQRRLQFVMVGEKVLHTKEDITYSVKIISMGMGFNTLALILSLALRFLWDDQLKFGYGIFFFQLVSNMILVILLRSTDLWIILLYLVV